MAVGGAVTDDVERRVVKLFTTNRDTFRVEDRNRRLRVRADELRKGMEVTDQQLPGFQAATPMPEFDGGTYEHEFDYERLGKQMRTVAGVMLDGEWRTLEEISYRTGYPEASISARLRDLRKRKFGRHVVNRRARGDRERGLFEYQLLRREQ